MLHEILFDIIFLLSKTYLTGAPATSKGIASVNETIGGFPCFQVKDPDEKLGFLSYGGYMFGDTEKEMST